MIQNTPFEYLKSFKYKKVLDGTANGVHDFYEKIIEEQFKNIQIIEEQHESIIRYINESSPTFFIRLYGSFKRSNYHLQRRGFLTQYKNGVKSVFCDNTFTLMFSGMKLAGIPYSSSDLVHVLNNKNLIVGFAQVSQEKELSYYTPKNAIRFNLNSLGWYQAHIHEVGKGYNGLSLKEYFPNPKRSEYDIISKKRVLDYNLNKIELQVLKAHFVRLIHPFNSFLVPKKNHIEYQGSNIGEEPELINYVKERVKEIFPKSYSEFKSYSLLENETPLISKSLDKIKWYSNSRFNQINKDTKLKKGKELHETKGYVEHSSTRFFVNEKIYQRLIRNSLSKFVLNVNPNKGKHPKGIYNIPNSVIVKFIERKRSSFNWEKNKTFHQDGIPRDLKTYFNKSSYN